MKTKLITSVEPGAVLEPAQHTRPKNKARKDSIVINLFLVLALGYFLYGIIVPRTFDPVGDTIKRYEEKRKSLPN